MRFSSTQQIIYSEYGDPNKVLRLENKEIDEQQTLDSGKVFVKWQESTINPADINQIQGVYPIKPQLPAIGGNEGCAMVLKVGNGVADLKPGDRVIPAQAGLGTWCSHGVYAREQLFRIDSSRLDVVAASMLQVNPPTAYRMLHDFVRLTRGDRVVQNGANSAVGQFVIQMCRIMGFHSVNVVRQRPEGIDALKAELEALGASEVYTEEEFAQQLRLMKPPSAKLALNCVGGKSALQLCRALGPSGCMVPYGGMSQQPVQVPTAALIFTDVTLRGFWMSRWYEQQQEGGKTNSEERHRMYAKIGEWYAAGALRMPPVKEWPLGQYKEAVERATGGPQTGQKRCKQIFRMADEQTT